MHTQNTAERWHLWEILMVPPNGYLQGGNDIEGSHGTIEWYGVGFSPRRSTPRQDTGWRKAVATTMPQAKRLPPISITTVNRNKVTASQWLTQGPGTLGARLGSDASTRLALCCSILSWKLWNTWHNWCLMSHSSSSRSWGCYHYQPLQQVPGSPCITHKTSLILHTCSVSWYI